MPLPSPYPVVGGTTIASAWGTSVVDGLPQIGTVSMWVGDTAPPDYLMCRGQAVSRTTYLALWNLCRNPSGLGRFGDGDGSTTFNVPDMRGRYPFGHNAGGGYGQLGVGQTFGNKDAVALLPHQHGVPNHLHSYSGVTAGANARHIHGLPSIVLIQSTAAPTFYVHVTGGGGFDIASTLYDLSGLTTAGDSPDHGHGYSGYTDGADRDLTSGVAGNDITNGRLPPSLSLNFVVRYA